MQLRTYLQRGKIAPAVFASAVGVSVTTVYRWLAGDRFPLRHLDEIERVTHGAVKANDFAALRRKQP